MLLRFLTTLWLALLCGVAPSLAQPAPQAPVPAPSPSPVQTAKKAAEGVPTPTADGATRPAQPPTAKRPPPRVPPRRASPPPAGCTEVNLVRHGKLTGKGLKGLSMRVTDNVFALEGRPWNDRAAVRLEADDAHVVLDLHRVHELRALAVQADNNDSYVVEGSTDGVTYKRLWATPIAALPGLRTRATKLRKVHSARYLRVKGVGGDGRFSISELRAHCKVPKTWPPRLRVPPRKVGWKMLTNPMMVSLKAWLALAGLLTLLGMCVPYRWRPLRYRPWLQLPLLLGGLGAVVAWWLTANRHYLIGGGATLALWYVVRWTNGDAESRTGWAQRLGVRLTSPRWSSWVFSLAVVGAAVGMFFFIEENPKFGPRTVPHIGALLCGAGAAITVAALWLALRWARRPPSFARSARMTLCIIGLISLSAWWNVGHFHFDHFIHIWEQYHYVVGAKFGAELRYDRIYACTSVADNEDHVGKRVRERRMRALGSDNDLIKTTEILAHPERCKGAFTEDRWQAFRRDIRFFRGRFSRDRWDKSQTDHGYNATPVWSIAARLISESIGKLTWNKIVYLGSIDFSLLILMWLVTWWAFGWRATCAALIFWGCNFPARYYWNGGGFLRYDWILWLVMGICMLKRRQNFLAGVALTYATGLRVFPGFVVAALVLKALARMVRERRFVLSRAHTIFAVGCISTIAVLTPASDWAMGGLDSWGEFAVNSEKHLKTALTNNMGLKTALGYDSATRAAHTRSKRFLDPFKEWKEARNYFYAKRAPILYGLIFLFCLILARAGDREEDWVAACLGTGLIVIAAELTCYYYGFLLAYGLMLDRRKMPAIVVTGLSAATCGLYELFPWNDDHFAAMSLLTTLMVVGVTAHVAFGKRLPPEPWPPAPASTDPAPRAPC